jgi:hypothetical protein
MSGIDFFVYNVYYRNYKSNEEKYLSWESLEIFCGFLRLKTVPFIEHRLFDWPDKTAYLKDYAKDKYGNGKDREGVVIHYNSGAEPMPKALWGMSNMWSFKCINDDYILGK